MCRVMSAVDCWRDCKSVFTARNSMPSTSASTMRLTALTPAPPTPTTRITGCPSEPVSPAPADRHSAGCWRTYSSITGRAAGGSITFSGISEEKAWRRRSRGLATCVGSSAAPGDAGRLCDAAGESAGGSSPAPSALSSAVLRNKAASGPSRMLARLAFAMCEDLLRELPIGLSCHAVRLVLEHRHPLHGRLGESDRLADAGGEHAVAEVFLEDLDRLLGVDRARIHQGREDTLDVHPRVEILADHRK